MTYPKFWTILKAWELSGQPGGHLFKLPLTWPSELGIYASISPVDVINFGSLLRKHYRTQQLSGTHSPRVLVCLGRGAMAFLKVRLLAVFTDLCYITHENKKNIMSCQMKATGKWTVSWNSAPLPPAPLYLILSLPRRNSRAQIIKYPQPPRLTNPISFAYYQGTSCRIKGTKEPEPLYQISAILSVSFTCVPLM